LSLGLEGSSLLSSGLEGSVAGMPAGAVVGDEMGLAVGTAVGAATGLFVGPAVGSAIIGAAVGAADGSAVGTSIVSARPVLESSCIEASNLSLATVASRDQPLSAKDVVTAAWVCVEITIKPSNTVINMTTENIVIANFL
jgi:hypothetical protein